MNRRRMKEWGEDCHEGSEQSEGKLRRWAGRRGVQKRKNDLIRYSKAGVGKFKFLCKGTHFRDQ